MIGYGFVLMGFFAFFMLTLPYKKRQRRKLDRKKHQLWMFYGMAMFLLDRIPRKKQQENSSVNRMIQEIHVKEEIQKERYLYFTEKIATSIFILFLALVIGLGVSITEQKDAKRQMKEISREEGMEETYELLVKKEGKETESVQITVEERVPSEEELEEILARNQKELEKEFLGENKTIKEIRKNVNLISVLGEEHILVTWEISDDSIVNYEGKLSKEIPKEGCPVEFTATMTLEDVSVTHKISTIIFPREGMDCLEYRLQEFIDESDSSTKKIPLPKEIDGEKVQFFSRTNPIGKWILPVGFFLAIAVFFLKDQELKEQRKERNCQMEADYPELVGQLILYYRAGLSFHSTIEKILRDYQEEKRYRKEYFRYAYEELELVETKIRSGVSETQAMQEYGERCGIQNYMKLAGIIEQNQRRGTKELLSALQTEQRSALTEKKNRALRTGGEISTKLLGPMVIMLIITMVIVVVPSFLSMSIN